MKTLIVFYSRTGLTKKVALSLIEKIGADLEEIIDTDKRAGILGYVRSGREAVMKKLATIEATKYLPNDYELVIIATPLWAGTMASPVRSYLSKFKDQLKKIAFFTTQQGVGQEKVFKILEDFCGQKSLANLSVLSKDVVRGDYQDKLDAFVAQYEKNSAL